MNSLPSEVLNRQGILFGNPEHHQLRMNFETGEPNAWFQPISCYRAGKSILRGQPVSIGYTKEFDDITARLTGEPCIVPTDPHLHQWSIGIALEPGEITNDIATNATVRVHVLNSGRLVFKANESRPNCFSPPKDASGKFIWNYEEDIGKPVYVSNVPGHVGELTIDITEAYYDGANIITIGHLADAPTKTSSGAIEDQDIIIEVQLSGDSRGLIDSTQFDVDIIPLPQGQASAPQNNYTDRDRLVCVKIVEYTTGRPRGVIIMDDATMLENGAQNAPVGAFLAEPGVDYHGKTVLVHRLGIIEGKTINGFGWSNDQFGKELFLSNGLLTTIGSNDSYEYKVGVVIDNNRTLVDCRYPRVFQKFEMIGKVQPIYDGDNLNPGYMKVDNTPHDAADYYDKFTDIGLAKVLLHQDIAYWYESNGTTPITIGPQMRMGNHNGVVSIINYDDNGNPIAYHDNPIFVFKDLMYQLGGSQIKTQIKFSNEGNPDNLQYVWPSKVFHHQLTKGNSGPATVQDPLIKFDITDLVEVGETVDINENMVDDYEAVIIMNNETDQVGNILNELKNLQMSSGFYSVNRRSIVDVASGQIDPVTNVEIVTQYERNDPWLAGFEWSIQKQINELTGEYRYFMCMITKPIQMPGSVTTPQSPQAYPDQTNPITNDHVLGLCYPPGHPIDNPVNITVLIRRRPVFYHGLMLNQLYSDSTWNADLFSDGFNMGTNGKMYFDSILRAPGVIPSMDYSKSNSLSIRAAAVNPLDPSFNDPNFKYKIMEIVYGVLNEGALYKTDVAVERHQNMWPSSGNSDTPIDLIYNFNDTSIASNASMEMLFKFPRTNAANFPSMGSPSKILATGASTYGFAGLKTRDAMKTLHELTTHIFEYAAFPGVKMIGQIQVGLNNPALCPPANSKRWIFDETQSNANAIDSMYYEYESNLSTTTSTMTEWELLNQERQYTYGDRNNSQIIQNTVGLLVQGAKETQDRLIKLERSMFGGDAPSLPLSIEDQDYSLYNNNGLNYAEAQTNPGVLRLIRRLYGKDEFNGVIFESDTQGVASYLLDMYYELYNESGYLVTENAYETKPNKLKTGLFHKVWYWYKEHSKGYYWQIPNYHNIWDFNSTIESQHTANTIATALSLGQFPSWFRDSVGKKVYPWPIVSEDITREGNPMGNESGGYMPETLPNFGFLRPSEAFYCSNMFGVSNTDPKPHSPPWIGNVDTQSIEGILYDLMLKMSYIKNCFDDKYEYLKPESTLLAAVGFIDSNIKVYGTEVPKQLVIRTARPDNYSSGLYSAFGFKEGKFAYFRHLIISELAKYTYISNKDYVPAQVPGPDTNLVILLTDATPDTKKAKDPLDLTTNNINKSLKIKAKQFDESQLIFSKEDHIGTISTSTAAGEIKAIANVVEQTTNSYRSTTNATNTGFNCAAWNGTNVVAVTGILNSASVPITSSGDNATFTPSFSVSDFKINGNSYSASANAGGLQNVINAAVHVMNVIITGNGISVSVALPVAVGKAVFKVPQQDAAVSGTVKTNIPLEISLKMEEDLENVLNLRVKGKYGSGSGVEQGSTVVNPIISIDNFRVQDSQVTKKEIKMTDESYVVLRSDRVLEVIQLKQKSGSNNYPAADSGSIIP